MPKHRMTEEERAKRKATIMRYIEETALLLATVLAILMADILQKLMEGSDVENSDLNLNIVNIIASSILAVIVYGKRYTNFRETDKKKPPFLLRLSDAIIYGIGFRGIVGIGTSQG